MRIKVYQEDGKTRDERETCFPAINERQKSENKGAGTR